MKWKLTKVIKKLLAEKGMNSIRPVNLTQEINGKELVINFALLDSERSIGVPERFDTSRAKHLGQVQFISLISLLPNRIVVVNKTPYNTSTIRKVLKMTGKKVRLYSLEVGLGKDNTYKSYILFFYGKGILVAMAPTSIQSYNGIEERHTFLPSLLKKASKTTKRETVWEALL